VDLTTMRYLMEIAREGHMTRAAERLGVSQPTLSAAVRRAEEELGSALFDRTGRGVRATAAGEAYLEHAEQAVRKADEAADAVRSLRGLRSGRIAIGGGATVVSALLPGVVGRFLSSHPEVRFYVREAGSAVAAAVLSGELDLGVVTRPTRVVGEAELMDVAEVRDELRLIVPPGHGLAGRPSFSWRDLAGEAVVGFEAGSAVRRLLDSAAGAEGVQLRVVMELRSIDAIRRMVAAGIGVGFVSALALERGGGIACADGALGRELVVVRRRDRTPSDAAGAFERMMIEAIGELGGREDRPTREVGP
jgi:DNA-binding transcriptional LysR family regulator